MPKISEHALAVAISALAARIRDLKLQLQANERAGHGLSDEEVQLRGHHETIHSFARARDGLLRPDGLGSHPT